MAQRLPHAPPARPPPGPHAPPRWGTGRGAGAEVGDGWPPAPSGSKEARRRASFRRNSAFVASVPMSFRMMCLETPPHMAEVRGESTSGASGAGDGNTTRRPGPGPGDAATVRPGVYPRRRSGATGEEGRKASRGDGGGGGAGSVSPGRGQLGRGMRGRVCRCYCLSAPLSPFPLHT